MMFRSVVLCGAAMLVSSCLDWTISNNDVDADADGDDDADDVTADGDADTDVDVDTDSDTDADSDTDVDADTDTDADTDVDVDADTDADTDADVLEPGSICDCDEQCRGYSEDHRGLCMAGICGTTATYPCGGTDDPSRGCPAGFDCWGICAGIACLPRCDTFTCPHGCNRDVCIAYTAWHDDCDPECAACCS